MKITMNILLGLWILMSVASAASTFLLDNEGWTVNQGFNRNLNKGYAKDAKHYEYNTGNLNRYITGKDAIVNVDWKHKDDADLWYFVSPPSDDKPVGKGPYAITFTMSSFMGDFKKVNAETKERAVILRSSNPTIELWVSMPTEYDGTEQTFWIPLIGATTRKKGEDGRLSRVSDRDIQKVIENLKEIAILGDWTQGIEMIGLDNVAIEAM
jgi:hypothetical protein